MIILGGGQVGTCASSSSSSSARKYDLPVGAPKHPVFSFPSGLASVSSLVKFAMGRRSSGDRNVEGVNFFVVLIKYCWCV